MRDARRLQGACLPGGEEDQPREDDQGDALGEKWERTCHLGHFLHPHTPPLPSFSQAPLTLHTTSKFGDGKEKKNTAPSPKRRFLPKQVFNTAPLRFLRSGQVGLALPRTLSVRVVVMPAETPKVSSAYRKLKPFTVEGSSV